MRTLLVLCLTLTLACARGDAPPPVPDTPAADVPAAPPPPPPPAPPPPAPVNGEAGRGWPAVQQELPRWELRLAQEDYRRLEDHLDDTDFRVPAVFVEGGREYPCEVRFRGRSTRYKAKKSFQVRFPDEGRFRGLKRLELLASWRDGGHLTEKLWYDLAQALRVPASRAQHVLLSVRHTGAPLPPEQAPRDTPFEGAVYLQLESVTKDFLAPRGFDPDSDVYRCGMHDCELSDGPRRSFMGAWEKRTNEKEGMAALERFLAGVNRTAPADFAAWAEANLDLDAYLDWMVLQELVAVLLHQDSRSFLVQDRASGRWSYVPWDLNNAESVAYRMHVNGTRQGYASRARRPALAYSAFDPQSWDEYLERQAHYADIAPAWNTLTSRILAEPALRRRFLARLDEVLRTEFLPERLCPRLVATAQLLAPHQRHETALSGYDWGNQASVPAGTYSFVDGAFIAPVSASDPTPFSAWWLCQFVTARRAFLLDEVERLGRAPSHSPVQLAGAGVDVGGKAWVELVNRGEDAQRLAGLFLSGDLRAPVKWALPDVALAPGERVRFVEDAEAAAERLGTHLTPERPELGLFAADGHTPLDLWWLPPLAPGEAYVRPAGAQHPQREVR